MTVTKHSILASHWLTRLALVGCGGALAACVDTGPEAELLGERAQESQCGGTWDVQDVERYDGTLGVSQLFVAQHEPRVGYAVGPGCTGTLISDDLFISAGHCGYVVNDVIRFDYQVDGSGVSRTTRDFLVTQVVEQELNSIYDYAILRLADNPGRIYGHAAIAAVDPPAGSTVAIIQHPARDRKRIHAGPVLDYSSSVGVNWFRHQVDTVGGSSGSGVLNLAGQLVGVHTNAGCATSGTIGGNSAMRMSQLVPHSPTLQALVRSRILWQESATGRISLWSVNSDGSMRTYTEHGPFVGWTPIGITNNRILWKHTSNMVSLWRIDDNGNQTSYTEYGPYTDWTPVNYSNNRLLWRHTTGKIMLWTLDDAGSITGYAVHGPFAGWTAVNYANSHLLWKHTSGLISLWTVNDAGLQTGYWEYGPNTDWTPVNYENGELLWRHADGRTSQWRFNLRNGSGAYFENGPFDGWTPMAWIDRKLMWAQSNGKISLWSVNGDGAQMSYVEHGPFTGWAPLLIAGGRP